MIDGILAALAPRLAADRAESRLRLSQAQAQTRIVQSYDAASVGGRMSGWRRPATSQNSEAQAALQILRGGARELARNNPHANRALRVLASHIAGTGLRPRPDLGADAPDTDATTREKRAARDQWQRFTENCDPDGRTDWYGQQRLLIRAVAEGGEALRIWTPTTDQGRLFWRCSVVEGDHLDHLRNEEYRDGRRIVQGVEFDALGQRIAYWLHETHPGERFRVMSRLTSRRVPAEYVDHAFEMLRPGQVRGISWFAPVALTIRDLGDLAEATVVKKKIEACLAMVLTNAEGAPMGGLGSAGLDGAKDDAGAVVTDSSGAAVERLRPGMIVSAPPGWDAKFNQPTSSGDLVPHMAERLHAVAAGIGVTYAQLTGDMSGASYSSMREGRLEFNRLIDSWQDDLMIHQTGRPAWRRVMDAAVANGDIERRPRAKFTRPERPWVDPSKDMAAALDGARAGVGSMQDIMERRGLDPDDVLSENAEWQRKAREAKLQFSVDFTLKEGGDAP